MKRAAIGFLLVSVLAGSLALADSNPRWNGHRGEGPRHERSHAHDPGRKHDTRRHDDHRRNDRRVVVEKHVHHHHPVHKPRFERGRYHWGHYHRPPGYVARHWRHGDRLPRAYYAPTYVIHDYHACGLRRPPHGHHWVRVDGHALLVAVATGLVLDAVYDRFW